MRVKGFGRLTEAAQNFICKSNIGSIRLRCDRLEAHQELQFGASKSDGKTDPDSGQGRGRFVERHSLVSGADLSHR